MKLAEAISKQELLIISRRPIQTTFVQEPSAPNYSQPAEEGLRSAGDVTEQFVKWERETLEALIDLNPSDAAEKDSRWILALLDGCKLLSSPLSSSSSSSSSQNA